MSRQGDRRSGIRDQVLDAAIDGAVREMLDVEPAADLRDRVMDRIDGRPTNSVASAFGRNFWTLAVPVAAAAVIVLAVLAPWRDAPLIEQPPFTSRGDTRLTAEATAPPPIVPPAPPREPVQATRVAANRPAPGTVLAADATGEDVNFTAVAALASPPSIALERLAEPAPASLPSIEPAPLEIRALQINALSETPRERREE
jgi:hypothetical protein